MLSLKLLSGLSSLLNEIHGVRLASLSPSLFIASSLRRTLGAPPLCVSCCRTAARPRLQETGVPSPVVVRRPSPLPPRPAQPVSGWARCTSRNHWRSQQGIWPGETCSCGWVAAPSCPASGSPLPLLPLAWLAAQSPLRGALVSSQTRRVCARETGLCGGGRRPACGLPGRRGGSRARRSALLCVW